MRTGNAALNKGVTSCTSTDCVHCWYDAKLKDEFSCFRGDLDDIEPDHFHDRFLVTINCEEAGDPNVTISPWAKHKAPSSTVIFSNKQEADEVTESFGEPMIYSAFEQNCSGHRLLESRFIEKKEEFRFFEPNPKIISTVTLSLLLSCTFLLS